MKKFLSLILSLMLCFGVMAPAMAEDLTVTQETSFSFDLATYQSIFDMLCQNITGTTPVWTVSEDGLSATASIEGYSDVVFALDAEGKVKNLTTMLLATSDTMNTVAANYGMIIAAAGVSVLMTEDETFATGDGPNTFATEFETLLNSLLSDIMSAITGETVKVIGTICETSCACTLSINIETMEFTFGFFMAPEGTVIE
ncbi:MAG: hypothetical protein IJ438_01480 [Clostridia bacterium]|nr:hypothetical protein [Clostridia bacterium]